MLSVTNNIKEKLSVIIAYFHLNFGIVCKALNMIYFGKWQKLIFDVFTGFWIFLGLIGYMIVLIYVKWWYMVDPYKDYSEPWFGDHRVLRGGCLVTRARLLRNTWRNFYTPDRRDVFAGFRTAAIE